MKFPYMRLGFGIYRPILPFAISYKNGKPLNYFGLVDSGADNTLVSSELASLLGIQNVKAGRKESVIGIGGVSEVYFHRVMIIVGGHRFSIEAGFTNDAALKNLGHGLLGQIGLFDNCTVKFNRRKFEMEIVPVAPDHKR